MFRAKYKKYLLLPAILMTMTIISIPIVVYAAPAGCPGGPTGPPAAGTVCDDGSTPITDPSLPYGCPGSAAFGPPAANYTTNCPSRPGRAECTYTDATKACVAGGGGGSEGDKVAPVKSDCKGTDIEANATGDKHCAILDYLVLFIKFLSGIVGVAVVASIIIGGIQYSMSGDDPSAVTAAKKRILNAIIALALYVFMFAFLEYLIPGGIL